MSMVRRTPEMDRRLLNTIAEVECLTTPQRAMLFGVLIGMITAAANRGHKVPESDAMGWALDYVDQQIAEAKRKIGEDGVIQ